MSDVSELAPRLRYLSDRNAGTFIGDMFGEAADALETLAGENAELNALFDLQHTRMAEATQLWRRETGRENVSPDLGRLLEWLMERYAEEVIVSESRLAKLAPVVEAARQEVASGMCQSVRLVEALATLEAAHDTDR